MSTDKPKTSWLDKLSPDEQTFLLLTDKSTLDQYNDPEGFWDVRASDIATELYEMAVDLQLGFAEKMALIQLIDKVGRLDGRPGTEELRHWQAGARAASVIAQRPKEGGHTEEFYLAHLSRYTESAQENSAYAAGADCVAAAILASKRDE